MSTRTAFRTRITDLPIADGPSGQHVVWATVYFYPEEARLNNLDLIRLMMYRVLNRQVTVDELPRHHRYSHCLSIRVAGELPDGTQSMKWLKSCWTTFIRRSNWENWLSIGHIAGSGKSRAFGVLTGCFRHSCQINVSC
ncbi:unnamed protein product [Penicillium nalgiovense]|nr:unnamed protein product [Penicillium nalgiovense]